MTTLSLRTCQRLHELLSGIGAEYVWEPGVAQPTRSDSEGGVSSLSIPAYSFSDLCRLLPALAEKIGLVKKSVVVDRTFLTACDIVAIYYKAPTPEEGMRLVDEYVYGLIK